VRTLGTPEVGVTLDRFEHQYILLLVNETAIVASISNNNVEQSTRISAEIVDSSVVAFVILYLQARGNITPRVQPYVLPGL